MWNSDENDWKRDHKDLYIPHYDGVRYGSYAAGRGRWDIKIEAKALLEESDVDGKH